MNDSLTMQVDDLTDARLLSLAIKFDAGPLPIVNGKKFNPEWRDADNFHAYIEWRGKGWSISREGRSVLNKEGQWEFEGLPSSRTAADFERTRYATCLEAFTAYFLWRDRTIKEFRELSS